MIEIICDSCAYAADRDKPGLHEMCKSPATCGCQHYAVGFCQRKPAEEVEVIELTLAEWEAAEQRTLDSIGLTYNELAEKARRRELSWEETKVWYVVKKYPVEGAE